MSFKDYQKEVDDWINKFDIKYFPIHEQLACLTEEVGEVARQINHMYGSKKKKPAEETSELGEELADVVFALVCIANTSRIDLHEAWNRKMEKLKIRDAKRYIK
ncbi:MAG TPA: nucleotide pyrophosphohydrolase [Candidatus Nanoarchaeia archaeon]|nr:nucleotide pyrophosphohydrolase [Candidatus Nanoarchaeia archaeon]